VAASFLSDVVQGLRGKGSLFKLGKMVWATIPVTRHKFKILSGAGAEVFGVGGVLGKLHRDLVTQIEGEAETRLTKTGGVCQLDMKKNVSRKKKENS